jgi:hypothetical protein
MRSISRIVRNTSTASVRRSTYLVPSIVVPAAAAILTHYNVKVASSLWASRTKSTSTETHTRTMSSVSGDSLRSTSSTVYDRIILKGLEFHSYHGMVWYDMI